MGGDFNIHSESVDVEQIMRQIRARIREKRGVDYTEDEIRQLASVKLEQFLDPRNVRSDLLEHYRRRHPAPPPEELGYTFHDSTIYESSRGLAGRLIVLIRRILNPLLKLFFNPNPIIHVLHLQGQINNGFVQQFRTREELDALNYEVLNNLVVEMTRLGIEVKNLKMRVESLSSRLDFDERRARALEGVVQYRPGAVPPAAREGTPAAPAEDSGAEADEGRSEGRPSRRRRRRGRRRSTLPAEAAGGIHQMPSRSEGQEQTVSPDPADRQDITFAERDSAGEAQRDAGDRERTDAGDS